MPAPQHRPSPQHAHHHAGSPLPTTPRTSPVPSPTTPPAPTPAPQPDPATARTNQPTTPHPRHPPAPHQPPTTPTIAVGAHRGRGRLVGYCGFVVAGVWGQFLGRLRRSHVRRLGALGSGRGNVIGGRRFNWVPSAPRAAPSAMPPIRRCRHCSHGCPTPTTSTTPTPPHWCFPGTTSRHWSCHTNGPSTPDLVARRDVAEPVRRQIQHRAPHRELQHVSPIRGVHVQANTRRTCRTGRITLTSDSRFLAVHFGFAAIAARPRYIRSARLGVTPVVGKA